MLVSYRYDNMWSVVSRVWIWKPLKALALRLWSQVHGTIRHYGPHKRYGMTEGFPVIEGMALKGL